VVPIEDLVNAMSYSASFVDKVVEKAREPGVATTSYVLLIYEFRYDVKVTDKTDSSYFRFVGAFPYGHDCGRID